MKALGLHFIGPQAPNDRRAEPWPEELPRASKNVPTFHTVRKLAGHGNTSARLRLASETSADRVQVRALNGAEEWGRATTAASSISAPLVR